MEWPQVIIHFIWPTLHYKISNSAQNCIFTRFPTNELTIYTLYLFPDYFQIRKYFSDSSTSTDSLISSLPILDRLSAGPLSSPLMCLILKLYPAKNTTHLYIRLGAICVILFFGPKMYVRGLWSVSNMKLRPYIYWWNVFTPNTRATTSLSSWE